MEITGNQTIAAPRQQVWDALNDPEVLKKSLPGCVSVERTSPEDFKVVMAAAIGPLRARFNGVLKMSDVHAPESCTLIFEGQGGTIGFGKGHSAVKLTELNGQTELSYTAEAQVGGKLAQVGSRLIDSVARKMADDFFKAFKAQLAGEPEAVSDTAATAPATKVAANASSVPNVPAPVATSTSPAVVNDPATLMVPGWWLAIAAVIGSATTLAGVLLAR